MLWTRLVQIFDVWRHNRMRLDDVFIASTAIEAYEKRLLRIVREWSSKSFIRFNIRDGVEREELVFVIDYMEAIWLLPVNGMSSKLIVENYKLQKKLIARLNRDFLFTTAAK